MGGTRGIILTIAGSDPSGGAGIQADIHTIGAHGAHAASVVTAVTAQNSRGVCDVHVVPGAFVAAQLEAILSDMPVGAAKTGMLGDKAVVTAVASKLRGVAWPWVCDPVLRSSSGHRLLAAGGERDVLERLMPLAPVVTPNAPELEALTHMPAATPEQAVPAARVLLAAGARAVVVTGGHFSDAAVDVLVTKRTVRFFRGDRLACRHTHGTGCVFSAALTARLGRGEELETAVAGAKAFVTAAIAAGAAYGSGPGAVDPLLLSQRGRSLAQRGTGLS